MDAQVVFNLVNAITNDQANVTYPVSDLILAINDAQRLVCNNRADAKSGSENLALVAGAKQTLPSTARRLLDVVKNTGEDGITVGNAITSIVSIEDLNLFNPGWQTDIGAEVQEYLYDERVPNEFYIYPAVTPPFYIEIKTSGNPIDIVDGNSDIDVNEIYSPCLVSWVCYRLFSRDGTESPNYARAESHKKTVFDILGVKYTADAQASPNK